MSQVEDNNIPNSPLVSPSNTTVDTNKPVTDVQEAPTEIWTYILVGILIVSIVILFWYAWNKWATGSEEYVDEKEVVKDDKLADFNLRDMIEDIEAKQQKILQRLTSDVGI